MPREPYGTRRDYAFPDAKTEIQQGRHQFGFGFARQTLNASDRCGDAPRIEITGLDDQSADITFQVNHDVRPDSVMILRAAQQVVAQEEFDDMLDTTRDRVDQIEGASSVRQRQGGLS